MASAGSDWLAAAPRERRARRLLVLAGALLIVLH